MTYLGSFYMAHSLLVLIQPKIKRRKDCDKIEYRIKDCVKIRRTKDRDKIK